MKHLVPVSVIISAYNEEKKIIDCLESVKWADEVIVIDNESVDKTAAIAKKHGAKVFSKPNNLMLNVNKNFGFSKAKNEWLLSLDADERVSSELAEEIDSLLRGNDKGIAGFWIPRKNIIFGKWIQHTGWYPDHQLRLFKKEKGRFEEKHVHEMIKLEGEAGYLQAHLVHLNYESIAQFLHKTLVIYAPNEADQLREKGYTFSYFDALTFPLNEFLRRFFAQEGYKDGFYGLMLSLLMASYHLIVFANLWEKTGYKDKASVELMNELETEIKKGYKEVLYWLTQMKLNQTINPVKKVYLRIKKRLSFL